MATLKMSNPFALDSKEPQWEKFADYLKGEVRFASVMKQFPAEISCKCEQMLAFAVRRSRDWLHDSVEAADLFKAAEDNAKWRYRSYQRMLGAELNKHESAE